MRGVGGSTGGGGRGGGGGAVYAVDVVEGGADDGVEGAEVGECHVFVVAVVVVVGGGEEDESEKGCGL